MHAEVITSRSNPLITRIRKLASDKALRRAEGVFLGEGPKLLEEALRWNAALETVVRVEGVELPALPSPVRVVEVPEDLLRSAAPTQSPQGVLFLCRGEVLALPERLEGVRYLVLDGVQDPGNVGTIWRTADAFGADGLILTGPCADPWNPKTVRATMGACFRLPVWETGLEALNARLLEAGLPLYATALRNDTVDLRQADLSRCAVVIGSEGRGVSQRTLELCTQTLRIPMTERCESLNAALAAGIVLWEGFRTREP